MGLPLQQLKLSQDLINQAAEYAKLINCEFDERGRPLYSDSIIAAWHDFGCPETVEMSECYSRFRIFLEMYSSEDLVRSMVVQVIILLNAAHDGDGIKDIEKEVRSAFSREKPDLLAWTITETGEWWVNRSLRVSADPAKNSKMNNSAGEIDFYGIACHAYRQFCYKLISDVIQFIEYGTSWTNEKR